MTVTTTTGYSLRLIRPLISNDGETRRMTLIASKTYSGFGADPNVENSYFLVFCFSTLPTAFKLTHIPISPDDGLD